MTASITSDVNYLEIAPHLAADIDMRGRQRYCSLTRARIPALRTEESGTLRGRSRHRSISPNRSQTRSRTRSRARSPILRTSNDIRLAYHAKQREARRDHCPSRASSPHPTEPPYHRQQRTKSRNRSALVELQQMTQACQSG